MSLPIHPSKHRIAWLASPLVVIVFALFGLLPAQGENTAAISQGFKTTETDLTNGALVSLTSNSQGAVQLSNTSRANQLIGVMGDKSLVELSNNVKEIQVVISGTTQTLVSDINGEVRTGDRITSSPINGVGMRASGSVLAVGTAQSDLVKVATTTKVVSDKTGQPQSVKIGIIPVQVNVSYYASQENVKTTFIPPFIQNLAQTVSGGKDVSPVRILVSILILALGFVSICVLLYSSIRSSIISIGRNPLSETAVRKSLIEISATCIGILLVMLIAIYLVLTV